MKNKEWFVVCWNVPGRIKQTVASGYHGCKMVRDEIANLKRDGIKLSDIQILTDEIGKSRVDCTRKFIK